MKDYSTDTIVDEIYLSGDAYNAQIVKDNILSAYARCIDIQKGKQAARYIAPLKLVSLDLSVYTDSIPYIQKNVKKLLSEEDQLVLLDSKSNCLNADNNRLVNCASPIDPTDIANKTYMDVELKQKTNVLLLMHAADNYIPVDVDFAKLINDYLATKKVTILP